MKYKVLFILHMPPPVHGAAMMGKYIRDSELINEKLDCHYINLATAKNLEDIGKVGIAKLFQFVHLLGCICKAVRKLNPALVYVTPNAKGGPFLKDFVVVQLLKLLGCKIVLHYHNKGVKEYMNKGLFNTLYKFFFKNVRVILLSENLYEDVAMYVPRERVYFCPNGIPDRLIEVAGPENQKNELPHILFLSNLLIEKGILDVIEAAKILKDINYSFVCDIVGGETTELNAQQFNELIIEKGLSDVVIYHGKKYGEAKERIINKSDIFVFPTYYNNECFPLVLLEAMQQAKVCISTHEGGIPDIIDDGKTGYLIDKRNPQMLAAKLEELLKNPTLCSQMGQAGFEKYKQLYTLKVFEKNILNILNQVI